MSVGRDVRSESPHPWGKSHCKAGLKYYKLGFIYITAYKFNLVKLETSHTMILPPMVNVIELGSYFPANVWT